MLGVLVQSPLCALELFRSRPQALADSWLRAATSIAAVDLEGCGLSQPCYVKKAISLIADFGGRSVSWRRVTR
jgi:hypothetical protein